MFHVKRLAAVLFLGWQWACGPPSDVIFEPPLVSPVAEGDRFRVTFNPGPDVVRGFSADGRIVYRSRGLPGLEDRWGVLSVDPAGGSARLEASVYQAALSGSAQLRYDSAGRVLVLWRRPIPGTHGCPDPAPPPSPVIEVSLLRLEAVDGLPLSKIPTTTIPLPTIVGAGSGSQLVRVPPADQELRRHAVDPFGPALAPDGSGTAFLSDGETVFRIDLLDPDRPPVPVGSGAFPSLSPEGTVLAVAVPSGLDSASVFDTVVSGLFVCVQETRTIQAASWQIELIDLTDGTSRTLGAGIEPVFDPSGQRVLARRDQGLAWIDLAEGTVTSLASTGGAYAPAVSPDGETVAFSLDRDSSDVFFVRMAQ